MSETKRKKSRAPKSAPEPEPELTFNPAEIDGIMQRASVPAQDGGKAELRRRGCSIIIYPEQCLPGYLKHPVKVGICELNSTEELRAYRQAGGIRVEVTSGEDAVPDPNDPSQEGSVSEQALSMAFGRESLRLLNGRRLTPDERREFWEILGMGGRVAVGMAYMAYCTGADRGFLSRSLASAEVW